MISKDQEIEIKLLAENVNVNKFIKWCKEKGAVEYRYANGIDVYYKQGDNIIRHRHKGPKGGELAIKLRKTNLNIKDRHEIEMHLSNDTTIPSIDKFLKNSGFEKVFELYKTAHIFLFKRPKYSISIVVYNVGKKTKKGIKGRKKFMELEIEKGSKITPNTAKKNLDIWLKELKKDFDLSTPLNLSLYELYSNSLYRIVK